MGATMRMAEAMKAGSFDGLASGTSNKQLNEIFGRFA